MRTIDQCSNADTSLWRFARIGGIPSLSPSLYPNSIFACYALFSIRQPDDNPLYIRYGFPTDRFTPYDFRGRLRELGLYYYGIVVKTLQYLL